MIAGVLPFRNPKLPWDERTKDLVSRLSLKEKVEQLSHADPQDRKKSLGRATSAPIPRRQVGGYDYGVECNSGHTIGYGYRQQRTDAHATRTPATHFVCA